MAYVVGPADTPAQSTPAAHAFIYADEPPEQLKKALPALHGIRFETPTGGAADLLDSILTKTGEVISGMLHRMPNLVAKEEVTQTVDAPPQSAMYGSPGRGRNSMGSQQRFPDQQDTRRMTYTYRIVSTQDPVQGGLLDESRMDTHNRPVAASVNDPDSPHSVGFSTTWLYFLPGNVEESRFRYVGLQKIGNRETYVVAFAQKPERERLRTVLDTGTGRCSTSIQGLAWIDQTTYRIVRMQTDLLRPLPEIHVDQLRSTLNYGEVKIPQNGLTLWLPSDVEIAWKSQDQGAEERHRYSNYRLFSATAKILRTDGTPLE
jgi:hypothetical protein